MTNAAGGPVPAKTGAPDAKTLGAFGIIVLIGGLNFVAVRFSNRGLDPIYGAGLRFLIASILLFAFVAMRRIPLPTRTQLKGTLLYGVLGFAVSYAFAYIALVKLPSAVAAVLLASVPLLTLFLAVAHRVEVFTVRRLIGAAIAIAGIGVMVGTPSNVHIAVVPVLIMLGAAFSVAESGVIVKKFEMGHPVATNAVAMMVGAILLLATSLLFGEHWVLPSGSSTLIAFTYLILLGSIGLFGLYLFTLKRWTASAVSYMFVLAPVITSIAAASLADEPITAAVAVGGVIVLAGVYVGALSRKGR